MDLNATEFSEKTSQTVVQHPVSCTHSRPHPCTQACTRPGLFRTGPGGSDPHRLSASRSDADASNGCTGQESQQEDGYYYRCICGWSNNPMPVRWPSYNCWFLKTGLRGPLQMVLQYYRANVRIWLMPLTSKRSPAEKNCRRFFMTNLGFLFFNDTKACSLLNLIRRVGRGQGKGNQFDECRS